MLLPDDPSKLLLITTNLSIGKTTYIYNCKKDNIDEKFFIPVSALKKAIPYRTKSDIVKSLAFTEHDYIEASFWNKIPTIGKSVPLKYDTIVVNITGVIRTFIKFQNQNDNLFYQELINATNNIMTKRTIEKLVIINKELLELVKLIPIEHFSHQGFYEKTSNKLDSIIDQYRLKLLRDF